jgi:putative NADH-flavin reductase
MQIVIFGATGRVGQALLAGALARGHHVIAVVRDPSRVTLVSPNLTILQGAIGDDSALQRLPLEGCDALINVIGADPLKPSTIVTDSARALLGLARLKGIPRYLGITGVAEMPKTPFGTLTAFILRRTPVGHAIRDHNQAFALVRESPLAWSLVGCPYIVDGPAKGSFHTEAIFPGGFKTIHPGDVALALLGELEGNQHPRAIFGIWY